MRSLYKRKIVPAIAAFLDEPGIILLVGARQVGKTSILRLLMEELRTKGVTDTSIFYLDLEDIANLEILNSGVQEFRSFLKASGAASDVKNYIFIDEIQYMDNPSSFLKLIADHHKDLKLIVSGSSTLEIRQKFKDSLAGRKVVFEVYPLDFQEFLFFKDEKDLSEIVGRCDIRHIGTASGINDIPARFFAEKLARYFNEYIIFGGYPKIAMEQEHSKKLIYLSDIYNSYIKKDIKDIMRVENITAFNNLLKALAFQVGSLVNITELCNTVKVARETLERYLFLLENTFIIKTVTPFSSNPRKEISKMSKVYFIDTGLRNIVIKNLSDLNERADAGALIENGVCSNMLKNLAILEEIHFWRTLAGNEVDFVLLKDNGTVPVEVKYKTFKSSRVPVGIKNFSRDYGSKDAFVLTKDYFGVSENTVFIPVWLC